MCGVVWCGVVWCGVVWCDVKVTKSDLTNAVINACFLMLFKDLIRLLACYNDAVINLLGLFTLLHQLHVDQCWTVTL